MTAPIPAAPIVRRSVYAKGGTFADPTLLWYARGVKAMQQRPLADPTSWRFYGGIHDFDQSLWTSFGFWKAGEPKPSAANRSTYWQQCQHGTWYFLPWHRGYLLALEAILRKAITDAGGPTDWALPYWNYFDATEADLPPAFASAGWPDGQNDNPLFVRRRYGPDGDGTVTVPAEDVNLLAMDDDHFVGSGTAVDPGFGGADHGFQNRGRDHGGVERMPHDQVHGSVGGLLGGDPRRPGLMSTPQTAALDPIFYLHHANIDRLWEAWRGQAAVHTDPTDSGWLTGPVNGTFAMPLPNGSTWTYTPKAVRLLPVLRYSYDDLVSGTMPPAFHTQRRERLGLTPATTGRETVVADSVELLGANGGPLLIAGTQARTSVTLDPQVRAKVTESLTPAAADTAAGSAPDGAPDRVFLRLENIRGPGDGVTLRVYLGLPEGADPADHPESRAGTVGLFGVAAASDPDGEHAGDGLNAVLEITGIIDALHLDATVPESLDVTVVPRLPLPEGVELTVGRVSVYRKGG